MKYFVKFLVLITVFYACNTADVEVKGEKELWNETFAKEEGQVVSPQGYVVTNNVDDLKKILFDSDYDAYKITDIDFIESGTSEGTAAFVTYEFESFIHTIAFSKGNIVIGYKNSGDVIIKKKTVPENVTKGERTTVYSCKGKGCCYVGGTRDLNDPNGSHTFFCKCENNPEGNSDCSLSVTEVNTEHTLEPGK
nr:hypothetical protein [uncultured Flavobacterium sp.]